MSRSSPSNVDDNNTSGFSLNLIMRLDVNPRHLVTDPGVGDIGLEESNFISSYVGVEPSKWVDVLLNSDKDSQLSEKVPPFSVMKVGNASIKPALNFVTDPLVSPTPSIAIIEGGQVLHPKSSHIKEHGS